MPYLNKVFNNIIFLRKYLADNYYSKIRPFFRSLYARVYQYIYIWLTFSKKTERLIIFLTAGVDYIGGGVMVVCANANKAKEFKHIHHSEVLVCTYPTDDYLLKYTKFENNIMLIRLDKALKYFTEIKHLIIHVPESYLKYFIETIDEAPYNKIIRSSYQVNVLIQHIKLLPELFISDTARKKFLNLTYTTTHDNFTNQDLRNRLSAPVHLLSVPLPIKPNPTVEFGNKRDWLLVSNDEHPLKEEIIKRICKENPNIEIININNIPYAKFLEHCTYAKWSVTFGEGLDYYFVVPVVFGGVSFAAYNNDFFLPKFKVLPTVYDSYTEMFDRISKDIGHFNSPLIYNTYNKQQLDLVELVYSNEKYHKCSENFYRQDYSFK